MDTERDRNARRASASLVHGYAIVCDAAAIVVLGYAIGFIAGAGVPATVDSGVRVSWPLPAAIDLALLLVFALQHTLMARPAVKRRLTELLPRAAAITGYILIGIRFEERDLRRELRGVYASYRAHVPALVPGMRARSRPHGSMQAGGMR